MKWLCETLNCATGQSNAKENYFQEEKKQGLDGLLCAKESSVGNLLKELFLQDQSESDKIFELCEWVKPIHASQGKKNKSWMGHKPQSLQLGICLKNFCCKINLRATRSLCCVKPIHTPQMLMLAKGNYFQEEKKNKAWMGYYVPQSLQLGICSKNFSCNINLRAARSFSCVSG